MTSIAFQREDLLNYVAHWFSREKYLKAYQFFVIAVKDREFWQMSEEGPLMPPLIKRMPS